MGVRLVFQLLHLAAVLSLRLLVGGAEEDGRTAAQSRLAFIYNQHWC